MDEARAVLERIRRIDALRRERAGPAALLAEVERLVLEAGAWLDAEGDDDEAFAALGRTRGAVERTRKAMIAM
jgi:hypothetical protein